MLRVKRVERYVIDNNIQVIHAHLPWAGIVARIVGKRTGIPVVYTEHNKLERYHFLTRWMNVLTMNWLRKIIAVSDDVATSVKKFKPSLKAELQVILNGVNVESFKPGVGAADVRSSLNIPLNAPVIGTIAVFRFQKRLDLWMDLAIKIAGKFPDVHFLIVGDGPLKAELFKKKEELKLDRLHFSGLQTEVRPYLQTMDVYMMSSVFEGLPIALLEAMASGCAVISTDAGGIKEVIRHDVDGMLCKVDEPERLVDFANDLLGHPERRDQLAVAARKRVVESFCIATMVGQLETAYSQLVKGNS